MFKYTFLQKHFMWDIYILSIGFIIIGPVEVSDGLVQNTYTGPVTCPKFSNFRTLVYLVMGHIQKCSKCASGTFPQLYKIQSLH